MEKINLNASGERQDVAFLGQQIYQNILNQIIEVQIEPGERINIAKLAADLGVSRTPIRTAMDQLIRDGLVKQVSDRGYQVIPIGITDCFDLCDTRKILEGTAAYLATNKITRADLDILEQSVATAQEFLARKEYGVGAFAEQDTIFHETLLRAADNRYLVLVYNTIKTRITRYRHIIATYCRDSAEEDTYHAITKHICILRAVKNRYSSVAKNEMEEHIAYTYRTLFSLGQFIEKK